MVSSVGGERMDAYYRKNNRTTMAIPPSSPSLVDLHLLVATSLNATCTRPFDCSQPRGHGCACRCPLWALFVVRQSLGELLLLASLLGGRWRSLASRLLGAGRRCPLCVRLSNCGVVVVVLGPGSICGGGSCMMWHAGDKAGTRVVVDTGDVAVWLSDWFVRQ